MICSITTARIAFVTANVIQTFGERVCSPRGVNNSHSTTRGTLVALSFESIESVNLTAMTCFGLIDRSRISPFTSKRQPASQSCGELTVNMFLE